ncbi:unnamed protein product [Rhizophagus irregularis]|nr:unnamed protein product [Rhizophagus irregularis]
MDADIPGNELQRRHRYSRKSAPMDISSGGNGSDLNTESHWKSVLPYPQKISSDVNTDIPGFPFGFYQIG